jgi:hypothetical protein
MPGAYDDLIPSDPVLSQVKQRESGGKNLPPEANYAFPKSHASGLYQVQPDTWKAWAKETGIGQEYAEAYKAPTAVQTANAKFAENKYGPNASYTWAASAPPGGYKGASGGAKGAYDDLIPKKPAGGAYDDLIPQKQQAAPSRVPPANEGPRANIRGVPQGMPAPSTLAPQMGPQQRPPGPMDPSIMARQGAAPQPLTGAGAAASAEGMAMQQAKGSAIAKWLGQKAEHGYEWASKLPPDLLSNAIGSVQDWGANKVQDTATAIFRQMGVSNPETQAHGLTDLLINLPMSQIGTRPMEMPGAPRVAPAIEGLPKEVGEVGTGVPSLPGAKPDAMGSSLEARESPVPMHDRPAMSAGAAATPTHEVLAENIRAKEATLDATDPTFKQSMRQAGNALKSIYAPETHRDVETGEQHGLDAAANIREKIGRNEQAKQQAAQGLNQYYKMFNGVTAEEGLTVLKWLQKPETRKDGPYEPTPEVSGFMKTFGDQMMKVQRVLESLPKTENMGFKQNFVSQMWQNPDAVMGRLMGKGGSNYFTKKSVWDSYEDGIRQGGIPISTNPLEIGLRYIDNAHNLITKYQILDEGADTGRIVWRNPGEQPKGWMQVQGAEGYKGQGKLAYAPPGYAEIYNNYATRPVQGSRGDLLGFIQRNANRATQVNLGLSGFHSSLMTQESTASGIANAMDNIAGGKVLTGFAKLAEGSVPGLYAATSIMRAKEGIKAYFDESGTVGSPKTQKAVKALVDANFRMKGRGNITDEYRSSFLPDLVTSFRKGRLKMEAQQAYADIVKHPVAGTGRQVADLVFRTLDTLSAPVFQYMVPRLKTGAALDMMYTYMRKKPNATDDELAAYARQVSNMIDDRFGEMNHDNIFLSQTQKAIMQSMLVSYSYEYGSLRAGVGAVGDTGRMLAGKGGWTPRMSYPIALFASMAIHSSIYQYLMTGKPPGSMADLRNPQTGGTDPKSGQPGRATLPNQLNQVFGFLNDPEGELGNKLNTILKTVYALGGTLSPTGGYDYKNDPIVNKNAPGIDQMAQAAYYAMHQFLPISVSQQRQPRSAIPGWQAGMGVRDAPHRMVDPQGSSEGLRYVNAEKEVKRRQGLPDGDPQALPHYIPYYTKKKYIQQEMNRYRQ